MRHDGGPGRGALAGLIGGAAGLLAMTGYWAMVEGITGKDPREEAQKEAKAAGDPLPEESSTAKGGRVIYETVTGRQPDEKTANYLSWAFDWSYTLGMSAAYGVVRRSIPQVRIGFGTGFGTAVWILGDEIGVWLLGLAAAPTRYPAKVHAHSAAGHAIYGAALEGVAAGVDSALKRALR
ncbi:MAG: DUF1440 domain-containing protein [Chloroflexota bacterium]|nr:DUF1440 domain-containing protein [Chloroflexota bacterium]